MSGHFLAINVSSPTDKTDKRHNKSRPREKYFLFSIRYCLEIKLKIMFFPLFVDHEEKYRQNKTF